MKSTLQTRQLLAAVAAGEPVSGAQLAERLGVTRAAVWKHMAGLRASGVPLEARTGLGYSLPWPIQLLDCGEMARGMPGFDPAGVEIHWQLDSTSSEVSRRAAELPDLAVVMSEGQRNGRGRRGRNWLSPPGLNVYLSCLKRFSEGIASLSGLSLAVGVAVAEAIEAVGARDIGLKWPNDLMADGGKLAGILVELSGEYQGPCRAVIGVGLNVRLSAAMRAQIDQPVTDLVELCAPGLPDRNRVAASVIVHLRKALRHFEQAGLAGFAERYAQRDLLRDRALRVLGAQGPFDGVGAGLDAQGALQVRTRKGLVRVDSAEVSVRAR